MNKICVYAIAKNEAKNVELWVASMRPADHIIVLDTGSTDNTVELLTSFGVEVHEKTYEHFRFDEARNDALALVPEEYNILVSVDLDERWEQDNWADIIRENWNENVPRIQYNYVWTHDETGQPQNQFFINKIHGRKNIAWAGAVHEYLYNTETGKKDDFMVVDLTKLLTLHHYHDLKKDRSFYLNLIDERIIENPNDGQTWLLAGNEYLVKGHPEKALSFYQHYVEHFVKGVDTYDIWELSNGYYCLGKTYYQLKDAQKAWESYSKGISINPEYRDNYFGLALLCLDNNFIEMAIGILQEALKTSKNNHGWMDEIYAWTFALYDLLGIAYSLKEEWDKAAGYAAKALSYSPDNPLLLERYTSYLNNMI